MNSLRHVLVRKFLDSKFRKYQWLDTLVTGTFSKYGFEFDYKGDWIWYSWPWRGQKFRWISTSFEAGFNSLEALDKEWDGYFKACQDANSR